MVLNAQWEPDKAGNAGQKKKEKRNKEQVQPKQSIMNMRDINETLQIILNVNGLNVPIKRHS